LRSAKVNPPFSVHCVEALEAIPGEVTHDWHTPSPYSLKLTVKGEYRARYVITE
jgi:hypothetical protein